MAKVNVTMNVKYNYIIDVPEEIIKRDLIIKSYEDEYALTDYCEEFDPVFNAISNSMNCDNIDFWDACLMKIYDNETGEFYYED